MSALIAIVCVAYYSFISFVVLFFISMLKPSQRGKYTRSIYMRTAFVALWPVMIAILLLIEVSIFTIRDVPKLFKNFRTSIDSEYEYLK